MRAILIIALLFLPRVALAQVDYLRQIKPLLTSKCYSCHSAIKQEAGLRLETRALMLKGGENGAVIRPGQAKASLILKRVLAGDDERMPPLDEGARLTAAEVKLLRTWIAQGAQAPAEKTPANPRDHWAFQPPKRPALPGRLPSEWMTNPIDRLLAASQRSQQLQPLELAAPGVRLRRLYVDLIGIPPTRAQLNAFLKNPSDQNYRRIAASLLANKMYGERWGRHWMDVWRYTDWYGLGAQVRYSQKHIWRWRDWIIESVNEDKPYSRMVLEMLAGDEIAPQDPKIVRATGFLARNYFLFNRTTWLNGTVEHTTKSLLGLTLNCARCHDHKYDPLQQVDFYRMRAIFEPHQVRLDPVPGETDLNRDGLPRAFDNNPKTPTYLFVRGNEKSPDKKNPIKPGVPLLFGHKFQPQEVKLPATAYAPRVQKFVLADHLAKVTKDLAAAKAELSRARLALLAFKGTKSPTKKEPGKSGKPGKLFLRDDFVRAAPQTWQVGPGKWIIKGGQLIQSTPGTRLMRLYYRTRQNHPTDFVATVKLKLLSTSGLRSVGFGFDVAGGRDKFVYLSGGGGKVQIAYGRSPNYTYPTSALSMLPFPSGVIHTMTIRVRGRLVNVSINGKHRVAYQLPVKRESGKLDLAVYDTAVAFQSVEVRALGVNEQLVQLKPKLNKAAAAEAVKVAEKKLQLAQSHATAIRTAHQADRALSGLDGVKKPALLVKQAAVADLQYKLRIAELAVIKRQQQLARAAAAQKAKLQTGLNADLAKLKQAQAAAKKPGKKYYSLRTTLRAANGMTDEATPRQGPYSPVSTGRRTALAKWIIDRRNPLTARVAVNTIWQRHFGQALVPSMTDFGLRSKRPVQHQLLDWLAVELMENGWRIKPLHQLIVTSRAYQLSSSLAAADQKTLRRDGENQHYWRRVPIRMESQVVRDAMLHIAGVLDPKMGGPTVNPAQEANIYRRSLYLTHSRDDRSKFISMFDDADILQCYKRKASIVPQQALAMSNSKLALKMSGLIAERLTKELAAETSDGSSDRLFVRIAFESLLQSKPTAEEEAVCLAAVKETKQLLASKKVAKRPAQQRARQNLVHALLNHNDFITVR